MRRVNGSVGVVEIARIVHVKNDGDLNKSHSSRLGEKQMDCGFIFNVVATKFIDDFISERFDGALKIAGKDSEFPE